jgi:hypothetical protein
MTKALLGGKPLLGSSDVSWTLREGVRPNIQQFNMVPEDADALAGSRGAVKLVMNDITVSGLYVLNSSPGENPNISRVTVADRRWMWSYKHIRRYYNVRRNIGFKRIKDPVSPPENLSVIAKVWYAKWSLKDPNGNADPTSSKWRAGDILKDVLKVLSDNETSTFGSGFRVLNARLLETLRTLDIENLQVNDSGDQAVSRVLSYLPEAGIYIDYSGNATLYSKSSGREANMISLAGPKIVGQGDVRLVKNDLLRPREVHCLFSYESEVRFDFKESSTDTVTDDTRYAENVLPIPDFSLVVNGETLCQGTFITFDQAFAAWGAPPGFSGPLTHDLVQKSLVPFMDLWAGIGLAGAFAPDADWASRIAAIEIHYRRTYRVQRHWMDKIFALRAYRVSTVDQATGTRAPAIAYSDYCVLTGQRALFNEARGGVAQNDLSYAVNVKGYPLDDIIKTTSKAAPAHVKILDADQGIIHVDYQIDPYRLFEAILPGLMTLSGSEGSVAPDGLPLIAGPSADITNRGRPISYDAVGKSHIDNIPKLSKNHKIALILTAIPASPNDERVFYRVVVKPSDVRGILPAPAGNALGPIMEIQIGAAVETARVPWLDARSSDIEKLFGIGNDVNPPNLKDLVLNDSATNTNGAASLQAISRAAAARIYASLVNRFEGEMAADMNGGLHPDGWLSEVNHTIAPNGTAFSKLTLPDKIQPFDIFAFLDSSTRAIILKLATPDRTQ